MRPAKDRMLAFLRRQVLINEATEAGEKLRVEELRGRETEIRIDLFV
jgi:hypothetical protein